MELRQEDPAYRSDVAGVEFWSIFQEREARVCIHHILKKIKTKTELTNIQNTPSS